MDILYQSLKFLHIAAAAAWIGGLLALAVITARIALADVASFLTLRRQSLAFGQAVVGPVAGITLLAGVGMLWRSNFSFGGLWVAWGIVAIVASSLLGAFPIRLTGQAADRLAATSPADSQLAALQSRLTRLNLLNVLILASAIWAMVFKP